MGIMTNLSKICVSKDEFYQNVNTYLSHEHRSMRRGIGKVTITIVRISPSTLIATQLQLPETLDGRNMHRVCGLYSCETLVSLRTQHESSNPEILGHRQVIGEASSTMEVYHHQDQECQIAHRTCQYRRPSSQ